jgi:hypothetical protein
MLEAIPTATRQSNQIHNFAYFCSTELLKQFVYLSIELRLVASWNPEFKIDFVKADCSIAHSVGLLPLAVSAGNPLRWVHYFY